MQLISSAPLLSIGFWSETTTCPNSSIKKPKSDQNSKHFQRKKFKIEEARREILQK
jgi:hypothetical protein